MATIRECTICGKKYHPIKANQKYCPVCKSKKVGKRELHRVVCAICGDHFMTLLYNKKYCSKKCRDLSKIDLTRMKTKECKICHNYFKTTREEKIYCSRACAGEAKRIKDKAWRDAHV